MAFDEKSQNVPPTVENTGEKAEAKAENGGGKNAELQAEIAAAEKEAERVEGELIDLALEGEPEDSEKTKALAAKASELRGKLQDLEGEMEKINAKLATLEVGGSAETEAPTETTETKTIPELPKELKIKLENIINDIGSEKFLSNNEGKGMDSLLDLIDEFDKKPQETSDLLENVGLKVIEAINKQLEQKQKQRPDAKMFGTTSFKQLGTLVNKMQRFTPELADKYSEFILQATTENFSDKKPDEIRKGLYKIGDSKSVYSAMDNINVALALDRPLPDSLKKALADILPILEANDKSDEIKGNSSRFLTNDFIGRPISDSTPRGVKSEPLVIKVRELHKKIKAEFKS